jgi:hypothetical protein
MSDQTSGKGQLMPGEGGAFFLTCPCCGEELVMGFGDKGHVELLPRWGIPKEKDVAEAIQRAEHKMRGEE